MTKADSSSSSKAQRREAARLQAKKLREAQARRERRNRSLLIGGVVVLVLAVAAALFFIIREGTRSVITDVEAIPQQTSVDDGGISLGQDLVAGSENAGAPVLDVYLDFQCPHCADFEEVNAGDIDELVGAGDVTVRYHPVSILSEGDRQSWSYRAAEAAAVVADGAPEAYNDFQTGLFGLVGQAQAEPGDEEIIQLAREVGVPQDVADQISGTRFNPWVDATTRQMSRDGFGGTPTVLIDGEEFEEWGTPGALAEAIRGQSGE
ncbi:DsbA family protein [Georgenia alba]|uniref:DsbA family protein n=1 Tax=Georgenia alba TaxID=2233858 RepID=A0ABW2Q7B6_9MICO